MRIATVEEARRIDSRSQAERGLGAELLMEAAGSLAAREIEQSYFNELRRSFVLVVCGPGHNGGDGLVVARHLKSAGHEVFFVFLGDTPKRSRLTTIQAERAIACGCREIDVQDVTSVLDASALVVDAIYGIGLSRAVEGAVASIIEAMNSSHVPVVSLDVPSGLDADRGMELGVSVRADLTITFGLAKRGFFVSDGPSRVGRLRILPIGFPRELMIEEASSHRLFNGKTARRLLPKPTSQSNKSRNGRAAIVGGRPGMIGALLLAGQAAGRVGAGYVYAISHEEPREVVASSPEFQTLSSDDPDLFEKGKFDAMGIGPGLGVNEKTETFLRSLYDRKFTYAVLDADALTVLAKSHVPLMRSWILTPHAGELARLIGVEAKKIESDRYRYAKEAAEKFGCLVVLKGFRTVVSDGTRAAVIGSGNASLAKAGTGDVLTGMITGLLAKGLRPFAAASLGAYLHGRLADVWVKSGRDSLSLEPSDLVEALPLLLRRIREGGDA